jgi:type II secretion system protein N
MRRTANYVGYPAFAVVVAIMTMYLTLPRDRIKDRLEQMFAADPTSGQPLAIGMDTKIEDVSLTLFSGLGIKGTNLLLRTRPVNPTDKPQRYSVDDATVHFGLFGLMLGRPSYTFKVHALKGMATGDLSSSLEESSMKLQVGGVDLASLPPSPTGLPFEGTVSLSLDVVAKNNLMANANGSVAITIEDASIGDGKAKLSVPGDPFLSQGLTFPRIRLGKIAGQAAIEKGKARLDGFVIHSPDVDMTLEGYIELRDPIGMSQVHAYLKFKPSEALAKREPTIELLNNTMGAMAKRPDGFIGFQLTGPLTAVFPMPSKEPPPGVATRAIAAGTVSGAPPSGPPAGTTVLPPPSQPVHVATPVAPPPEPEREREQQREEPPAPVPAPPSVPMPPPGSTPSPSAVRANLNRALEEMNNKQHGEDPAGNVVAPAPPPPEGQPPPPPPKAE